MISAIAAALALAMQILRICWEVRQEAQARARDPEEEIIATNVAATRGDEAAVQTQFEEWSRRGRMRFPRDLLEPGVRPHEEAGGDRGTRGTRAPRDQTG